MITILELTKSLGAEFKGDGTCLITGIAPLNTAKSGQISFLDNPKYRKYLSTTMASAVILSPKHLSLCPTNAIVTDNPYYAYARAANFFALKRKSKVGIHSSAIIGVDCQIAESAFIAANTVIGDRVFIGEKVVVEPGCVIGDDCQLAANTQLAANVTLYYGTHIGERGLVHSGVVIGADGFGFAQSSQGWYKVPQLGGVKIGNDVEIGANTTIDRGALEDTVIEDGVKLDNQIQIGHNVKIGAHTIIAGCTAIAGSTIIGKYCIIAGSVDINGHITIADKTIVTAASCVSKSITEAGVYSSGTRAIEHGIWLKNAVHFEHLTTLAARLKKLEQLMEKV